MSKESQDLQDLEDLNTEEVVAEKPLQKLKVKKNETIIEVEKKTKKEKTPKQIEAFNKAREKMLDNLKVRKEKQDEEAVIKRIELENKIVSKAIAIKKKEIKKKAILDEIGDDDTSIEKIKKIAKKISTKEAKADEPKSFFEKYKFV